MKAEVGTEEPEEMIDRIEAAFRYSVMQSDGNSWKIDTFREAITSELVISS